MRCFKIQIVEEYPEPSFYENASDTGQTFLVDQVSWTKFPKGPGKNLVLAAELQCGRCGSFTVPAEVCLKAVAKYEDVEEFDPDHELFRNLVSPKFDNDEDFLKYWRDGGPDLHLIKGSDGDWVYDEITGYPLGLNYEDVVISMHPEPCLCCADLFSS